MSTKFTWDPTKATLLLQISEIPIPHTVIEFAQSNGYIPKSEFHLTLLSFQNGKKLIRAFNGDSAVLEEVPVIAGSFAWKIEFLNEYYLLERTIPEFILNGQVQTPGHTRRSIIQKVCADDMKPFMERTSRLAGMPFDVPFPHVTIFTWSDLPSESKNGIVLNSQEDFDRYTRGRLA